MVATPHRPGLLDTLRTIFTIDLRSLALFRMSMAGVMIFDLIQRWKYLEMFYTDEGILPREGLIELMGSRVAWSSLHVQASHSVLLQHCLFAVGMALAISLLIGFRTWWVTLLCWFFLVSMHDRNPWLQRGGDALMLVLMFWSLFLPLGARWSVDSVRVPPEERSSNRLCNVATAAILLQICYIYFFTFLLKWHPEWHEGRALGQALRIYFHSKPMGEWLADQTQLVMFMNYGALVLEAVGPFIALSPIWNRDCRWAAIIAFWGLHIGIFFTMKVNIFSFLSCGMWLLFIPPDGWDALFRWLNRNRDVEVATTGWFGLGKLLGRFGSVPDVRLPVMGAVLASLLLIFVTAYNVLGLKQVNNMGIRMPYTMVRIGKAIHNQQKWKMFAPFPDRWSGWFNIPAQLADGNVVDIWLGNDPPSAVKPERPGETYPNHVLMRFMTSRRLRPEEKTWLWFSRYVTRVWNRSHPPDQAIRHLQVLYLSDTLEPGITKISKMVKYDAVADRMIPLPKEAIPTDAVPDGERAD